MSISIEARCIDCNEAYEIGDEGPEDHAEDCPTRNALINIGRWEEP